MNWGLLGTLITVVGLGAVVIVGPPDFRRFVLVALGAVAATALIVLGLALVF